MNKVHRKPENLGAKRVAVNGVNSNLKEIKAVRTTRTVFYVIMTNKLQEHTEGYGIKSDGGINGIAGMDT